MKNEIIQNPESTNASRPWIKYLVTAGIGALAIFLVLLSRGVFGSEISEADRIKHLSDAFFLVGLLIACFGGLMFVSGEGAFDGLGYAFRSLSWFFTFSKGRHESFADYKERKHGGKKKSFLFLVIVGLFYVAIGAVFNTIFLSRFT